VIQSLIDFYWLHKKKRGWFGNYKSWEDAKNDCEGYDTEGIFEKVAAATHKVVNGEAAFERDGHLFYQKEDNTFLLECLEQIKSKEGRVSVLDFGGALGSTYFQHKAYLLGIDAQWGIVEQQRFVEIGQKNFQSDSLHFYNNIEEATIGIAPNVILFSSVLQYLDDPQWWIRKAAENKISFIILDLTTVIEGQNDRITKQIVSPQLYKASYACRLFGEQKLTDFINKYYIIQKEDYAHYRINISACRFKKYFGVLKI
jgi:putative methyltransferase (TIGR04325 family)